jgi:flagellar FliL protein
MAEEKDKAAAEKTEENAAEKPKKKFPIKLVVIVVAVIVLAAGGFFGWQVMAQNDEEPAEEVKEEEVVEETTVIYPLKSFVVNLLSRNGTTKNYLKVTMDIELSKEEYILEIEKQKAKVRDAVLMLLSSKTLKDISTVEGKLQLKQELLLRMNIILGQGTIKKIYFSEFVVQ